MKNKQNTTLSEQLQYPILKTNIRKKQTRYPKHSYTWQLNFLVWYRHFNKKWRD